MILKENTLSVRLCPDNSPCRRFPGIFGFFSYYNVVMHTDSLILISENIVHMTGINCLVFDCDENTLYEPEANMRWDMFSGDNAGFRKGFISYFKKDKRPLISIVETKAFESFIVIKVCKEGLFRGLIVVGPVMPAQHTDDELISALYRLGYNSSQTEYVNYLKSLPLCSFSELVDLGSFFYIDLYREMPDKEKILGSTFHLNGGQISRISREKKRVRHILEEQPVYSMKNESALLEAVETGRTKDIEKYFAALAENDVSVLAQDDSLRSVKNKAIAVITLSTRSAIKGGVNLEKVFAASDHYIQFVESSTSREQVGKLIFNVFIDFAGMVQEQETKEYSPLVRSTFQYIENHIYEEIKVEDIASGLMLSAGYLESRFKAETGTSLYQAVLKAKLEESKRILRYTDYSLSEISILLCFTDQSHFSKRFKQEYGVTPSKYRQNEKL